MLLVGGINCVLMYLVSRLEIAFAGDMDSLISISASCITVSLFWLCESVMTFFVVLYGIGEMMGGGGAST